jgi:hypothetical protein
LSRDLIAGGGFHHGEAARLIIGFLAASSGVRLRGSGKMPPGMSLPLQPDTQAYAYTEILLRPKKALGPGLV